MVTIGISIPKVPHEVPMEKLIRAAITKISTGRKPSGRDEFSTNPEINTPVPISCLHTPPSVQERINISIGGTIFPMPLTMQSMNSFGFISFLGIYRMPAVSSPANAPRDSPAVGLYPIASEKPTPSKNPPTYAIPSIAHMIRTKIGRTRSITFPLLSPDPALSTFSMSSLSAVCSAFFIGPKSLPVKEMTNTISIVMRA